MESNNLDPGLAHLLSLLQAFTSVDNVARTNAEQEYESLGQTKPQELLFMLLEVISASATAIPQHVRSLSAVLLRRLLIKGLSGGETMESIYYKLTAEQQSLMRQRLLFILGVEKDAKVKAGVADIVGEIAGLILEDTNSWPEIFPYIHESIKSADPLDRQTGLSLLGMLSNSYITSQLITSERLSQLISIFQTSLSDEANEGKVMVSAMRALTNLLIDVREESDVDCFVGLVEPIVRGLQIVIQRKGSGQMPASVAIAYVDSLIELTQERGSFFYNQMQQFYQAIIELIELPSKVVGKAVKHMLLEVLVSLAEYSPKRARKMKGPMGEKGFFLSRLLPVCVNMLASITDDPKWLTSQVAEGADDDSIANDDDDDEAEDGGGNGGTEETSKTSNKDWEVAEAVVDRVTTALGLKITLPIISAQLGILLSSASWQHQIAGLTIMGNYLAVTTAIEDKNQLNKHREDVASTLMAFSQNSNHRVRSYAFNAMAQLFYQHGKDMDKDKGITQGALDLALASLDINTNPSVRVRASVLGCLTSLLNRAPTSLLEASAAPILNAVTTTLTLGPLLLQELCVEALLTLVESVKGEKLAEYYDKLMPILKQLLVYAHSQGLESLWGQGLECCALVGEASGKVKFYPDALEMMRSLDSMQSVLAPSSEGHKYLMKAWVRVARCLGQEFLPFLHIVMEKIITSMSQNISDGTGDLDFDELEDRSDIEIIETQDGSFMAVRTAAVEEQSSACQLLYLLVEKLQEHFYPYVEQTVKAMAPLMNSPHEDVRQYCITTVPELIRATAKATTLNSSSSSIGGVDGRDRGPIVTLSEYLFGLLVETIRTESAPDIIMTGLLSLKISLFYSCIDWSALKAAAHASSGGDENSIMKLLQDDPESPVPSKCIPILNVAQMEAVTECTKLLLRDSIQRRAVMRAEAQVIPSGVDEFDEADEQLMVSERMELFYCVADVIGSMFRTHGTTYFPVYMSHWHSTILEMSRPICVKEDRAFAFNVLSDVCEFGLGPDTAQPFLSQMIPILCDAVKDAAASSSSSSHPSSSFNNTSIKPRHIGAYTLGVIAQMYPMCLVPFADMALSALGSSIAAGDEDGDARGECTDNAVASVGYIVEQMEALGISSPSYPHIWNQWLAYLPLEHDVTEGHKVVDQLLRLADKKHPTLITSDSSMVQVIAVVLQVFESKEDLSSPQIDASIARFLQDLVHNMPGGLVHVRNVVSQMRDKKGNEFSTKLERALAFRLGQAKGHLSLSPLATAPIQDVLLKR